MPAQPRALGYDTDQHLAFANGLTVTSGAGTPEAAVTAPVGSLFLRTDGAAATTLYAKTSGTGNTGWTAMTGA